jgi:hypothetical protein
MKTRGKSGSPPLNLNFSLASDSDSDSERRKSTRVPRAPQRFNPYWEPRPRLGSEGVQSNKGSTRSSKTPAALLKPNPKTQLSALPVATAALVQSLCPTTSLRLIKTFDNPRFVTYSYDTGLFVYALNRNEVANALLRSGLTQTIQENIMSSLDHQKTGITYNAMSVGTEVYFTLPETLSNRPHLFDGKISLLFCDRTDTAILVPQRILKDLPFFSVGSGRTVGYNVPGGNPLGIRNRWLSKMQTEMLAMPPRPPIQYNLSTLKGRKNALNAGKIDLYEYHRLSERQQQASQRSKPWSGTFSISSKTPNPYGSGYEPPKKKRKKSEGAGAGGSIFTQGLAQGFAQGFALAAQRKKRKSGKSK